jgi:hypothetical protein
MGLVTVVDLAGLEEKKAGKLVQEAVIIMKSLTTLNAYFRLLSTQDRSSLVENPLATHNSRPSSRESASSRAFMSPAPKSSISRASFASSLMT